MFCWDSSDPVAVCQKMYDELFFEQQLAVEAKNMLQIMDHTEQHFD